MSSDVINAMKRLKRAGEENSRATEKLRDAVQALAREVEQQMPDGLEVYELPRGYQLIRDGDCVDLESPIDPEYAPCRSRLNRSLVPISRTVALEFARDIADGWLSEVAAMLQSLARDSQMATAQLHVACNTEG